MAIPMIIPTALGSPQGFLNKATDNNSAEQSADFGKMLQDALADVNQLQLQSAQTDQQLAAGTLDNVQQAMIVTQKASLALEMTIQVRNKVVESYQEIMRTQF